MVCKCWSLQGRGVQEEARHLQGIQIHILIRVWLERNAVYWYVVVSAYVLAVPAWNYHTTSKHKSEYQDGIWIEEAGYLIL